MYASVQIQDTIERRSKLLNKKSKHKHVLMFSKIDKDFFILID